MFPSALRRPNVATGINDHVDALAQLGASQGNEPTRHVNENAFGVNAQAGRRLNMHSRWTGIKPC
jgi:hypothetical protein